MRYRLGVALAILAALGTAEARAARAFTAIVDAERELSAELSAPRDSVLEIRRLVVEPMRLDGPEGYTALLVRRRARTGATAPEDELTVFLSGQYRVLGYDAKQRTLVVGRVRRVGESFRIVGALALRQPYGPGTPIGPPGAYQFAAASPDGEMLVLVDDGVVVVDVESGRFRRLPVEPPLEPGGGLDGFRLDGEALRVSWKDGRSGTLELDDRRIPLELSD